MHTTMPRHVLAYAGVVTILFAVVHVHADEAASQPQSPRTKPRSVRKALDDNTSLEFVDTPLSDVTEYLQDVHKIEIRLDADALTAAGIDRDWPVTGALRAISLKTVLDLVLTRANLSYTVINDEVLLVTTRDVAKAHKETKIYDVRSWVPAEEAAALAEVLRKGLGQAAAKPEADDDNKTAAPDAGNSIEAYRGLLVVRGSFDIHWELEKLLAELKNKLPPPDSK